jgi:hypothetical protein
LPNEFSTEMESGGVDNNAMTRLVAEKFPSIQVNFPNPSSCGVRTKVTNCIHRVNCEGKKILFIFGLPRFAFQSRIF